MLVWCWDVGKWYRHSRRERSSHQLISATQITISKAATATGTAVTLTIVGDVFKIALFKASVSGTYGAATTNYSDMGADETSGTGYTATGLSLTNVSPTTSGYYSLCELLPNPFVDFGVVQLPDGCMIFNSSARLGVAAGSGAGRAMGVFSFGGTQTVSSGTLTILFPAATARTPRFCASPERTLVMARSYHLYSGYRLFSGDEIARLIRAMIDEVDGWWRICAACGGDCRNSPGPGQRSVMVEFGDGAVVYRL